VSASVTIFPVHLAAILLVVVVVLFLVIRQARRRYRRQVLAASDAIRAADHRASRADGDLPSARR
jgi:flagellar biosynthesis/type III secretory pathway M-ring protein FliF/YscJ